MAFTKNQKQPPYPEKDPVYQVAIGKLIFSVVYNVNEVSSLIICPQSCPSTSWDSRIGLDQGNPVTLVKRLAGDTHLEETQTHTYINVV